MKAILVACAALSFATIGCGSQHGLHYQIMIDPSLSPSQVEDVMAGGKMWEDAIPGLTLEYTITPCSDPGGWRNTVCVFWDDAIPPVDATYHISPNATTDWGSCPLGSTSSACDSATIHLWANVLAKETAPYAFANSVAHEFGHAFCHTGTHIAKGNLMYAGENGDVREGVESGDVDYFYAAR